MWVIYFLIYTSKLFTETSNKEEMTISVQSHRPVKVLRKFFYVREKEEWAEFMTS